MQGAILALVIVMAFRSAGRNSSSIIKPESICMCWSCDDEFGFLFQPNSVISMSILYVLTLHHRGDVTDKDG